MEVIRDIMKSPRIDKMDMYDLPPRHPMPGSFKSIANSLTGKRPASACEKRGGGMVMGTPMPMSARANSNRTSSVILISPRDLDIDIMNIDWLQNPPSLTVSERLCFL